MIENSIQCIEEVVIIDNASSDKTLEIISSSGLVAFPLKIIKNSQNIGYRRALNQGMTMCSSKYVVSVNLDIRFNRGNLCDLIQQAPFKEGVGCILPVVYQSNRNLPYIVSQETVPFLSIYNRVPKKNDRHIKDNFETEVCGGPCFIIDREAYLRSGGLDEKIPMYNEEVEMSVKMRNAGYKFEVTEKLEILHEWGSSSSDMPDKKRKLDFFIKNWLTSTIGLYEECSFYDSMLKIFIWKTLFLVKAFEYSLYQANISYLFFAFGLVKKFISTPTNLRIDFKWRIPLFFVNEFVELIRIVQRNVSWGDKA